MTYIDKYMELHPGENREQVMNRECPNNVFDMPDEPIIYCAFSELSGGCDDCKYCWQRTYRNEGVRSESR